MIVTFILWGAGLATPLSPVVHYISSPVTEIILHTTPSNKTSASDATSPKPLPLKVTVSPPKSHPYYGLILVS